jgi:16S rRNA (guanine966-N2)-methyltransferase
VRVIAGTMRGRRLEAPTWEGLRPTSDRLRETLFNVLAPRIGGARVLDGYAGTGAIGIEALSRGAREVVFVDRDRRARALIAANVARCGIASGCVIIRATFKALGVFDIALLDPPYDDSPELVIADAAALIAPSGVLVLEHARRQAAPEAAAGLRCTRQIRSGESMLSLYE